jgi:hypothetical protein
MEREPQSFRLTKHAAQRLQQRGIKVSTLELLYAYGRRVYGHNGAARLIFDHAARRQIEVALGKAAAQIKFSAYAVVEAARGSRVITVGHRRSGRFREFC